MIKIKNDILSTDCLIQYTELYINCLQKKLLEYFVMTFDKIYGSFNVSHNIHGLLHIASDYNHYGPLDQCSCFPFKNHMKEIKTALRKSEKPLQQLICR
ncbi:Uncharacterized protein FWK35_00001831 [Aphis craccivora]|uniref:Uncharacterized protein n=1 Tax=Aphis craccivora TaxID=307492 RepID=A0A6G0ZLE0_APHCR|nr:Uncharacterized protein FWK35_00001831 [Aphis craccivora]